jgi:AraC-like DNA-binding protein
MSKVVQADAASLLSTQVKDARYFFLNLAPRKSARFELVMGGFEHCHPDYVIARSHFPYYSIEYIVAGQGTAMVGRHRHELRPGVIFSYGLSERHEIRTDPRDVLVKYFISLRGTEVLPCMRRLRIGPGAARVLAPRAEIASAFDGLLREGQRTGPLRQELTAALLKFLLLKIEDAASFTAHPNERAREAFLRCKAYMDAEAENIHALRDVAQAMGAEASSVCRWFRRYQGMSPYQYLLRRRMNLAAEKLLEQGGLVKEVAARFGFADPFHFSHQFKAVHGIAPSALLRHNRGRPPARARAQSL